MKHNCDTNTEENIDLDSILEAFNSDSEIEESRGKYLSSLVRKTYCEYLESTLIQNYALCESKENHVNCSKPNIVNYAKMLEYKALRGCMISSIYRRLMINMIGEIKQYSQQGKLYYPPNNTWMKRKRKYSEKSIQTENFFQTALSNSESEKVFENYTNLTKESEKNTQNTLSENSNINHSHKSDISKKKDVDNNFSKKRKKNLDDRLMEIFGECKEVEISNQISTPIESAVQKDLTIHPHTPANLGINWELESTAHLCNLKKIFKEQSVKLQGRIRNRLTDLFGEDESLDDLTVSPNDEIKCKRRLASILVEQLTPFYEARRINGRNVFKQLAKKVSIALLKETYVPEITQIKHCIATLFENNRNYNKINELPELITVKKIN